ncbi:peptidase inhibitor family I36 protein [Kitasatospora sp. McL0602]|uniref:peptidase inhibitor family I36 protein n=1 Tax=Kitasatospora sp. McL0602 TaxID=3439530 RepID=UPI003F8B4BEE
MYGPEGWLPGHAAAGNGGADCPYTDLCMYTGPYYTGTRFDLHHCATYDLSNWNGIGSYVNNQTPNTWAVFQDANHRAFLMALSYVGDYDRDWTPAWYVVPCTG